MNSSSQQSARADATRQFIDRAKRGDEQAVEQLLGRFRPRLKQMVRLRMDPRLNARVDPSDIIQEAFVMATQQLDDYLQSEPIPFYPWLRRIAWQKLVHAREHHLEAQKRSVRLEQQNNRALSDASVNCMARLVDANLTSPSGAMVRRETRRRVQDALAQMSELDQEVLLQRYVEQLSAKEIAAGLTTSEAAVNMRHMRALERLQRLLGAESP